MASTMDFYATAVAVAETELPQHCEGKNLLPLLMEKKILILMKRYFGILMAQKRLAGNSGVL
ncbi:Choline-sulfatase [Crocosphaera watsonii WH 0402]|uniref:Choline-sulfatase n=2 Tax=Crocosphaera watsonii TaxID=263511 RepID=T2JTN2_CROWT|nr:Choline-sulfatase [Crocosphaera watsonii WH 0402]